MTTKEQILAEIERRKRRQGKSYYPAMMELLSILDILPDEPVEKTCKTCGFYENNCPFIRGKVIPYPSKVCKDYTFSTLKAEQEPVSEDLEEAAEKSAGQYYVDGGYSPFPKIETASHIAGLIAGAEWQKRKMMEGAVEGEVVILPRHEAYVNEKNNSNNSLEQYLLDNFKAGDEVRIIILPKE